MTLIQRTVGGSNKQIKFLAFLEGHSNVPQQSIEPKDQQKNRNDFKYEIRFYSQFCFRSPFLEKNL